MSTAKSSLPLLVARLAELSKMYQGMSWTLRDTYSLTECVAITGKSRMWLGKQLREERCCLRGTKIQTRSARPGSKPQEEWAVTAASIEEYLAFLQDQEALVAARAADPLGYYRGKRRPARPATPEEIIEKLTPEQLAVLRDLLKQDSKS